MTARAFSDVERFAILDSQRQRAYEHLLRCRRRVHEALEAERDARHTYEQLAQAVERVRDQFMERVPNDHLD